MKEFATISELFSDFKVCKDIGSGAFGRIYLVKN